MNPLIKDIALQMGLPPYAVRKWKLREAVPHKWRLPILAAAEKRGESLATKDFEFAKVKPKPSKRRKVA